MKSIRTKILVWCFAIVFGSFLGLMALTLWQAFSPSGPMRFVREMAVAQAEEAADLHLRAEPGRAQAYLAKLDRRLHARHTLLDARGRDVFTGRDHARELALARSRKGPVPDGPEALIVLPTEGNLFLLVRRPAPLDPLTQVPYLLLILAAMALFLWILAVDIEGPLRRMAAGVSRFGAGDLNARLRIDRRDELGQLGRAFDEMAARIQSLVQGERQLLQDISHELRSPLARLGVAIQLARRPDQRDRAITQMEREVSRLGELIGDLVAVTKAEGDASTVARHLLRLDLLAEEVVETCRVEAAAKSVQLSLAHTAGECELSGNSELLWRALENVIRNAIHHAPAGSTVEVTLARAGHDLEAAVRDYGPGVPAEDLPRIFRPFYRTDPSRTADTGGVGLGLSIAQRALHLHHGSIAAENAQPGLRVRLRLPAL